MILLARDTWSWLMTADLSKLNMIILHIRLDRTARDYLNFLFLKLPFIHFHGSRSNQPPVQRSCHKIPLNCKFMSNQANDHKVSWGGGGSVIFYSSEILCFVPNLFFKHNTESESFGHSFAKVLLKSTNMKWTCAPLLTKWLI